jgi:hypothetical protein
VEGNQSEECCESLKIENVGRLGVEDKIDDYYKVTDKELWSVYRSTVWNVGKLIGLNSRELF